MKRSLILRVFLIGSLTLLLFVPLFFIQGLIESRVSYRHEAIQSVVQSFADTQFVAGPAIVIPYAVSWQEQEELRHGGYKTVERNDKRFLLFFPTMLDIQSELPTRTRNRGIFNVETYNFNGLLSGHFDFVMPSISLKKGESLVATFPPELVLKVRDMRGLVGRPALTLNEKTLAWEKNTEASRAFSPALFSTLPALEPGQALKAEFKINLSLNGTNSISVAPIADDNNVYMSSSWPHPDFRGGFLPTKRNVTHNGFNATWRVSSLSSNAQSNFNSNNNWEWEEQGLVVRLINPVDPYTLATRATKYGFLFVALSFAAFFFLEGIKQLRVHPMQYLLVGTSMALFFLLLLSLSEHMPFGISYAIAAGASLGLLAFYLCFVLKSIRLGVGFAALLSILFSCLYGLLLSEDYALLLGSSLLFICLAVAMVLSRKLDWYALSKPFFSAEPLKTPPWPPVVFPAPSGIAEPPETSDKL
ncbi:MAG: cell envelope integrity protein CreD [Cystobacterineae bacterium]|nr:cell envelope integrity protein CreD [Cystobacterineae bacterium]